MTKPIIFAISTSLVFVGLVFIIMAVATPKLFLIAIPALGAGLCGMVWAD